MLRRFAQLLALTTLAWTGTVHALGLGDINLRSALNEPLDAEISLLSATPEEIRALTVQLAPRETFQRYGIDRPQFLSGIEFNVENTARGGVVRLRSRQPITEPFVTILVEAVWPRGRLLREYTVLLDPPTFARPDSAAAAPVAAARPADDDRVRRARPDSGAGAGPRPGATAYTGDSYTVQRNDTLWQIAERVRPTNDLSINQVMLSLFEENPSAFAGNINVVSAGATLRIPSADEMRQRSGRAALSEVRRQNDSWRSGSASTSSGSGSLRLVPPEDTGSAPSTGQVSGSDAGTGAPSSGSTADVAELRRQLAERERLLAVRDNELAELQARIAELEGASDADPSGTEAADSDADSVADVSPGVDLSEPADDDQIFVDDGEDATADPAAADDAATTGEPADAGPAQPRNVVAPRQEEPSLLESLTGSIWTWVALGLLGILGLLALLARLRRSGSDDDSTGTWESLDDYDDEPETREATTRLRALASDDESIVVVESEDPGPEPTIPADDFSTEDTFSSETAINLDRSDPMAEADFHMAYGLYDQAADLIKDAVAADPERTDLRAKLAEVYFVWGNQDAFVDAAENLRERIDEDSDEWDKIRIMGQQIAPTHALFAGAAVGSLDSVDLEFGDSEGGVSDLDVDFASDGDDSGGDIDVASSLESADHAASNVLDFSFDEDTGFDPGDGESDAVDHLDTGVAFADSDADAPTVERVADDGETQETPTIESPGMGGGDDATAEIPLMADGGDDKASQTAEINLDDLGLDLGSLDATNEHTGGFEIPEELDIDSSIETLGIDANDLDQVGGDDDETLLASAGDDDETLLAAASDDDETLLASAGDNDETLLAPGDDDGDDTEATMMGPIDIDESLLAGNDESVTVMQPEGIEDTGVTPALEGSDVDLDLDDLTAALKQSDFASADVRIDDETIERPLASPHESDFDDDLMTSTLGDDSGSDVDLDVGVSVDDTGNRTMTEVGTKLDLARAYIDMGDPDGARSILDEVAAEGTDAQQQEARKLLDDLPG